MERGQRNPSWSNARQERHVGRWAWRSEPNWAAAERISGFGVYNGTIIEVHCYQSGTTVEGSADTMWEQATDVVRTSCEPLPGLRTLGGLVGWSSSARVRQLPP